MFEGLVPSDHPQIRVDYGDSLIEQVEPGLQVLMPLEFSARDRSDRRRRRVLGGHAGGIRVVDMSRF